VSTFEDQESLQSTARTLRNDNACLAVTYFIRRVFEVDELRTRIVGIEVQVGSQWVDLGSTPFETLPPTPGEVQPEGAAGGRAPSGAALPTRSPQVEHQRRFSSQALRPCVAAKSFRAPGRIVRPETSTLGRPGAAARQSLAPAIRRKTPKSLAA